MAKPSLQLLKENLHSVLGQKTREYFICSLIKEGIPKSAIVELLGNAPITFIAKFLSEHTDVQVLWLRGQAYVFPPALAQFGSDLKRITFVHNETLQFENIRLAARSRTTPVIVAQGTFDEDHLKKLKFLIEEAKSTLFLISNKVTQAYSITAQFQIDHLDNDEDTLQITILKYKCDGLPPCE